MEMMSTGQGMVPKKSYLFAALFTLCNIETLNTLQSLCLDRLIESQEKSIKSKADSSTQISNTDINDVILDSVLSQLLSFKPQVSSSVKLLLAFQNQLFGMKTCRSIIIIFFTFSHGY
jgi:hypothetical protein